MSQTSQRIDQLIRNFRGPSGRSQGRALKALKSLNEEDMKYIASLMEVTGATSPSPGDAEHTLANIGRPAFGAILGVLNVSDSSVRVRAARLLGVLYDERAQAPLAALLSDSDVHVREAAATALEQVDIAVHLQSLAAAPCSDEKPQRAVAWGDIHKAARKGDIEELLAILMCNPTLVRERYLGGATPLHDAAYGGHRRVAQLLLECQAEVNAKGDNGGTPLHAAVVMGHKDVSALLLAQNALVDEIDAAGRTPLSIAVTNTDHEMVELLLANKANARSGTSLHIAAASGNLSVVRLLMAHDAEVNAKDKDGRTPRQLAAYGGHKDVSEFLRLHGGEDFVGEIGDAVRGANLEVVGTLLRDHPDLVFSQDNDGRTPLHMAASDGHEGVAELLLSNKANVDARDQNGRTPLHEAAASGHQLVAKLLLEHKAVVDATDHNRRTPLHSAASYGRTSVAELLLASKADVNAGQDGCGTPLCFAAAHSKKEMVELLLAWGGSIQGHNYYYESPLHAAAQRGSKEIAEILLAHGANVESVTYDADSYDGGETPLHYAARAGHKEVVEFLLDNNANINAVDNSGSTPLGRAASHISVVELLRRRGSHQ